MYALNLHCWGSTTLRVAVKALVSAMKKATVCVKSVVLGWIHRETTVRMTSDTCFISHNLH